MLRFFDSDCSLSDQCEVISVNDFTKRHVAEGGGDLVGAAALDAADLVGLIIGETPCNLNAVFVFQSHQRAGFEFALHIGDSDGQK